MEENTEGESCVEVYSLGCTGDALGALPEAHRNMGVRS